VTGRRHIFGWAGTAAAAMVLLTAILVWQSHQTAQRFTVYVPPKPVEGRIVFEQKGCTACHGDNGLGSANGPGTALARDHLQPAAARDCHVESRAADV
jgi:Cytochrome c